MQTSILILLAGSLFFVCGTLMFVLKEEQKLKRLMEQEVEKNRRFAKILHQVDDMLASVKWHTEMIEDSKESGKLNIAQQQLLHNIGTSVAEAIKLLKKNFTISSHDRRETPKKKISKKDTC